MLLRMKRPGLRHIQQIIRKTMLAHISRIGIRFTQLGYGIKIIPKPGKKTIPKRMKLVGLKHTIKPMMLYTQRVMMQRILRSGQRIGLKRILRIGSKHMIRLMMQYTQKPMMLLIQRFGKKHGQRIGAKFMMQPTTKIMEQTILRYGPSLG